MLADTYLAMFRFHRKISFKCDIAGIGSAVGGIASGAMSASAADRAAYLQYKATQETNALNRELAEKRNALEYQIFGEANEFNAEQADLSRQHAWAMQKDAQQYNSIGAQIERAQMAGLNPAAVAGGVGTTPVGSSPSGASASSASLPTMVAAQMQTPDLSALQGVASAYANIGQSVKDFATAANLREDTRSKNTFNKWYDQILEAGVKLDKSKAREAYAHAEEMQSSIDLIHKQVDEVQQRIALMASQGKLIDEQTFAQNIDNAFKSKEWQLHLENLEAIMNCNKTQAQYYAQTLVARVYGVQLSNQLTSAQVGLTKQQTEYFDKLSDLIVTNQQQAAFDYMQNRFFTPKERWQGLHLGSAALKGAEWDNSTPVRFLREAEGFVNTASKAVQAYGSVRSARAPRAAQKRNSNFFSFDE